MAQVGAWIGYSIGLLITPAFAGTRDVLCSKVAAWFGSLLLSPFLGSVGYYLAPLLLLYLLREQSCYQSTIHGLRYGIDTVKDYGYALGFFPGLICLAGYVGTVLFLFGYDFELSRFWLLLAFTILVLISSICVFVVMNADEVLVSLLVLLTTLIVRTNAGYIPVVGFCIHLNFYMYEVLKTLYFRLRRIRTEIFGDDRPPDSGQPYIWKPLDTKTDMRLLRISRKGVFGEYRCDIVNTSRESAPSYEAISYTWANLPKTQSLYIGGRVLSVSKRVLEIIDSRASISSEKFLWIDSICINQGDSVEKAAQIPQMKEIFNSAKVVIAWLGFVPDADECVRFLASYTFMLGMRTDEGYMQGQLENTRRQAFLNFLSNPYWTRVWILQELVVAEQIVLSYGRNYLSWKLLERVLGPMHGDANKFFGDGIHQSNFSAVEGLRQIGLVLILRNTFHVKKEKLALHTLLTWSIFNKATDPRDKVYSILGLTKSALEPTIMPDYAKNKGQLCTDVARHLYKDHLLGLLSQSGLGYRCRDASMPSWVPNYTGLRRMAAITLTDTTHSVHSFYPTGIASIQCELDRHLPVLTVDCLIFDSISQLGPENHVDTYSSRETVDSMTNPMAALWEIDRWVRSTTIPGIYIHTQQERDEALWRTIVGNRSIDGKSCKQPAPPDTGKIYAQIIEGSREYTATVNAGRNSRNSREALSRAFAAYQTLASSVEAVGRGRRIAITKNGALAWVPAGTQKGDVTGAMRGGQSCIVMRKEIMPPSAIPGINTTSTSGDWRYVGECYVHGFMDGEALSIGAWQKVHFW